MVGCIPTARSRRLANTQDRSAGPGSTAEAANRCTRRERWPGRRPPTTTLAVHRRDSTAAELGGTQLRPDCRAVGLDFSRRHAQRSRDITNRFRWTLSSRIRSSWNPARRLQLSNHDRHVDLGGLHRRWFSGTNLPRSLRTPRAGATILVRLSASFHWRPSLSEDTPTRRQTRRPTSAPFGFTRFTRFYDIQTTPPSAMAGDLIAPLHLRS